MKLPPIPRCRACKTEMVLTPTGTALVCPKDERHPMRVVITDETRVSVEVLGQDWAAITNYPETGTGPVNWAK